jgi:hypothetical protein
MKKANYVHIIQPWPDLQLGNLKEVYKEVLLALARATRYSSRAHVSRQAILSKYAFRDRRDVKKALIEISRMGLVTKHPTCTEMTFHITRLGLALVRDIEKEMGNS